MSNEKEQYPDNFLEPRNMLRLYAAGAFPMAESRYSDVVNWYLPDERTIIPLDNFNIPRSLRKFMEKTEYEVFFDLDYMAVLRGCQERENTWISEKLIKAYKGLQRFGHLHTVEIYMENLLVGGLYGITFRGAFFGESMFSRRTQASKIALAHLIFHLRECGFILLDVQYPTDHLAMFGTRIISMQEYTALLHEAYLLNSKF